MFTPDPGGRSAATSDLDFSDHGYVASRLVRRAVLGIRATRRPEAAATLARLSEPANQSRMVFVVGAARSGTTALQAALSASPEVFLLGEANFFWENLRSGFRARYNAKHRAFGWPPSKLNECPAVAPEDATWVEVLAALASQNRFVGDKIPFGGYKEGRWPSEFLAFHRRHFHRAAYILAFRNPRDAILSPRGALGVQNLIPWARSYIAAQRALIRLRANFPRTVPVFLETVGPATFQAIEQCLDCEMPLMSSVLRRVDESANDPERVPAELRATVVELEALYPTLRRAVSNAPSGCSDQEFDAIDRNLAQLYRRQDPLYYSMTSKLARLRSKVTTASRMAHNFIRPHANP